MSDPWRPPELRASDAAYTCALWRNVCLTVWSEPVDAERFAKLFGPAHLAVLRGPEAASRWVIDIGSTGAHMHADDDVLQAMAWVLDEARRAK